MKTYETLIKENKSIHLTLTNTRATLKLLPDTGLLIQDMLKDFMHRCSDEHYANSINVTLRGLIRLKDDTITCYLHDSNNKGKCNYRAFACFKDFKIEYFKFEKES
jgi:hypothetical protein